MLYHRRTIDLVFAISGHDLCLFHAHFSLSRVSNEKPYDTRIIIIQITHHINHKYNNKIVPNIFVRNYDFKMHCNT